MRSLAVCGDCRTHDCIRGNDTQRGCELLLFQPQKAGNFDCTFCLDCVHACPQDNVGVLATIPGRALIEKRTWRPDAAALAWILVFGALINAALMVDPVMNWMHSMRASAFWLVGILAAPALLAWKPQTRSYGFALVPLGFSMWVAHFSYHLLTGWHSIVPVLERFLHVSGQGVSLSGVVPSWLPAAQILLLDCGLLASLYIAWRTARRQIGAVLPWAVLAIGIYGASIWILFQPMQMRGMAM